ncbi:BTAD domain-containing putative transcriptional regulator [Lentzea sp. NBRC 102530]|uniref:AfsR/SARP family transcriptional regulator n=1 Tax=Lentzea sp. NBRC 102530 TaxID=3032201 RepID=UPI0024A068C3|nr:BTAD domain-containing putative transcriptional regulator [Lentzea sp. NBRC 102530]GLY53648.1 SARP family transcriptional regulator [Lentzea sp. NBRC 102530]
MQRRWGFRVLGSLQVIDSGRVVELRSAKQRVLLAALLMKPNAPVSSYELMEHLWGDEPSGAARATLQTYVMRLRQSLDDLADRKLVRTWPTGYSIHVEDDQLDLLTFQRLRAEARRAPDLETEARLLGEAAALWRGPALDQVSSLRMEQTDVQRLNEQRWEVLERRNDAELQLGRHDQVVDELRSLVTEHPLRERFWYQLMLALHRTGQQAQALDVFRRASDVLADELGIDPNAELRALHMEVLAGSSAPVVAAGTGPSWLPPAVGDFSGRAAEVVRLTAGLRAGGTWTITGPGGVGKTSLAVHCAHLVRDAFPDGQLYLNLRGGEQKPVEPAAALDRLLRGLGVSGGAIPSTVEDRVDLYRDLLSDRKILVVLDNAVNEAQVRPLLPGTTSGAALVTSRAALAGLEAAHVVPLDVLPSPDALALLRAAVGEARCAAEPVAAQQIVTYCGSLPLALRVAAARLVARPHWQLSKLAGRLSDERRRFDELSLGDLDVRASLALSYDGLDESHRTAFRLLSLVDTPDFPAWVASPLLGLDLDDAEDHVEALVDARLVDYAGRDALGQVRYRLHDLLRAFGREAASEDPAEALKALFEQWLELAMRADVELPHQGLRLEPLALERFDLGDAAEWFDAEWQNIHAVITQAAALGLGSLAAELAIRSAAFCDLRARFDDWEQINALGLTCAPADRRPVLFQQRGILRARLHDYAAASADFQAAQQGFVEAGDVWGEAYAWYGTGWMHEWSGRSLEARAAHREAMERFVAASNSHGEIEVLCSLGAIERRAGGLAAAQQYLERARRLAGRLGDEQSELMATLELGRLHQFTGELDESAAFLRSSLAAAQKLGDPDLAANIRLFLADTLVRSGQNEPAEEQLRQAWEFFEEHDDRQGRIWVWRLRSGLAAAPEEALRLASLALEQAREMGSPPEFGRSLRVLGNALDRCGRAEEAREHWRQAEETLTAAGFQAEVDELRLATS